MYHSGFRYPAWLKKYIIIAEIQRKFVLCSKCILKKRNKFWFFSSRNLKKNKKTFLYCIKSYKLECNHNNVFMFNKEEEHKFLYYMTLVWAIVFVQFIDIIIITIFIIYTSKLFGSILYAIVTVINLFYIIIGNYI